MTLNINKGSHVFVPGDLRGTILDEDFLTARYLVQWTYNHGANPNRPKAFKPHDRVNYLEWVQLSELARWWSEHERTITRQT